MSAGSAQTETPAALPDSSQPAAPAPTPPAETPPPADTTIPPADTTPPSATVPANPSAPTTLPPTPFPVVPPGGPAAPVGPPMSLQEAIRIAEQNHGNVKIAASSVEASHQRVTEARAGNKPIVTGDISYGITGITSPRSSNGGVGFGGSTTRSDPGLQPRVGLAWTLLDGGLTRAGVRQAQAGVVSSAANLTSTQNDLALTVATNYLAQLQAERILDLRVAQENLAQQQLNQVVARIEAGAAAEVERALPLSELRNRQVDRIQAQNSVQVTANALRNSMGLPVGPAFNLTDPESAYATLPPVESFLTEADQNRPDILVEQAQLKVAQESVSIARIQRNPRLDTTAGFTLTPENSSTHRSWDLGASISMPLWDAGLSKARVREAEAGVVSAQARLDQVRKDVGAEVQQAYLNLSSARDRLEASRLAVDAARANLDAATARYQLGLRGTSVVDLVSAQVQYNTASTDEIQARYDAFLAQEQLNHAIGRAPL